MSSSTISFQSSGIATETQSGLVSVSAQTFAGNKTFNGQIFTPNRITFNIGSTVAAANNSQQTYNTVYVNTGSSFSTSTNRFTAPVSGVYYFEWSNIKADNSATFVHRQYIRVNGTIALGDRHLRLSEGSQYGEGTCAAILILSQNDYVDVYVSHSSCSSYPSTSYAWFQGYLIG